MEFAACEKDVRTVLSLGAAYYGFFKAIRSQVKMRPSLSATANKVEGCRRDRRRRLPLPFEARRKRKAVPTMATLRRGAGKERLFDDLEAVFLDDWIGQNFLGDAFQLLLGFVAIPAVQIQHEKLALANVLDRFIAEVGEGVVDGLALWIENRALRHDPDVCFHVGSITLGTYVIETGT